MRDLLKVTDAQCRASLLLLPQHPSKAVLKVLTSQQGAHFCLRCGFSGTLNEEEAEEGGRDWGKEGVRWEKGRKRRI